MPTSIKPTKSTTVRPKNWRLSAIRASFIVLDRIAPRMAGRWALRIWCTLPTNSGRRQDNRHAPGHRSTVGLPDGRELAVETWEPAEAASTSTTVYLVHGWGGWRGQLGAFVSPLLEAGHRVVGFDAASHGDSASSALGRGKATAVDFTDALWAISRQYGEPHGIVAHSLGCATTTLALRDGLPAQRLVFIAPGPDPVGTTANLERVLGYGRRTRRFMFAGLSRLARRPLEDFNALTITSADDVPPALIIHDRDDKESPHDDGAGLAAAWPEAELVSTEGLGHQRILIDEHVVKLTVDYLIATA